MASLAIKVVVLGDSGVGKTSLINRFCNIPTLQPTEKREITTQSIVLPYPLKQPDIVAEFWDISNAFLAPVVDRYYANAHCVLIVYDVTNTSSFESATTKWFRDAAMRAFNGVIVMIGTKVDLMQSRKVQIEQVENFASVHDLFFMEVSSLDGTNIELVLKVLRIRAGLLLPPMQLAMQQTPTHEPTDGNTDLVTLKLSEVDLQAGGGASSDDFVDELSDNSSDEAYQFEYSTPTRPRTLEPTSTTIPTSPKPSDYKFVLKEFEERRGTLIPVFQSTALEDLSNRKQSTSTQSPPTTVSIPLTASPPPRAHPLPHTHPPSRPSSPPKHSLSHIPPSERNTQQIQANGTNSKRKIGKHIVIDVQLGANRAEQLVVRSGDNAHRLAAAFATQHGLDPACIRPLVSRIHHAIVEYSNEMIEHEQVPKKTEPHAVKPTTQPQPFNLSYSTPTSRRREILSFTVDMGPAKKGTITVREGDDPYQLARNFVKTFQLRKSLVDYIASQILEQLERHQSNFSESPPSKSPLYSNHDYFSYPPQSSSTVNPTPTTIPTTNYYHTNINNNTYNIHSTPNSSPTPQPYTPPPMNPILAQNASGLLSHFDADVLHPEFSKSKSFRPPSPTRSNASPTLSFSSPHPPRTPTPSSSPAVSLTSKRAHSTNPPTASPPRYSSSPTPSPLLFELEVDLPQGGRGVIRVHAGSSPRKLAHEFAVHHRLPTELVDVLEQTIMQQTRSHEKKTKESKVKADPFGGKVVKRG